MAGNPSSSGVFLNEDDAKKLQEGIEAISSIFNQSSRPADQEIAGPSGLGLRGSCNRALQVARSVREHFRGARAIDEQRANFAPYTQKVGKKRKICTSAAVPPPKKCTPWSTRFVCLADTDAEHVPCTVPQKEALIEAGLGEKKIEIPDIDCSAQSFKEELIKVFPKLKYAGGFELMRCLSNSKVLEPLSSSVALSPKLLRSVVGKGRIFIRPIQKDLDLDAPADDNDIKMKHPQLKESCLKCGVEVNVTDLREHINSCGVSRVNKEMDSPTQLMKGSESPDFPDAFPSSEMVPGYESDYVLLSSRSPSPERESTTLPGLLQSLVKKEIIQGDEYCVLEIRRSNVLKDGLKEARKSKFNHKKRLKIRFVGEGAIDHGGPLREFFRILFTSAKEEYLNGTFFAPNMAAVQDGDLFILGQYVAMSIAQGAGGFPFLSESVFKYLTTGVALGVTIENTDINDSMLRFVVNKIDAAEDKQELLVSLSIDESQGLLMEAGYRKPLCNLQLADKPAIRRVLLDYHLMIKVKMHMDKFADGLNQLKILEAMRAHPALFKPLFVYNEQKMSAEELKSLFYIKYSEEGHNRRPAELQCWVNFCDFLDACEASTEETSGCTIEDVMIFVTGSEKVPPLGFGGRRLRVEFLDTGLFCTSSTCDLTLRLPLIHGENYQAFEDAMILSLKNNDGFGGL